MNLLFLNFQPKAVSIFHIEHNLSEVTKNELENFLCNDYRFTSLEKQRFKRKWPIHSCPSNDCKYSYLINCKKID